MFLNDLTNWQLIWPSCEQVALLDVNKAAGESLMEVLRKQYEPDQMLFLPCNVESDEQFKGDAHKLLGGGKWVVAVLIKEKQLVTASYWSKQL